MKKTIMLLFILATFLNAQEIPDNAIAIIVKVEEGQDVFKMFGRILLKEGYSLEEVDKSFGIISTKPRLIKVSGSIMDHDLNMKIIGEVDSTTIMLHAKFSDPYFSGGTIDMHAKNTSGSFADAFGELNRLAKKLDHIIFWYTFHEGN